MCRLSEILKPWQFDGPSFVVDSQYYNPLLDFQERKQIVCHHRCCILSCAVCLQWGEIKLGMRSFQFHLHFPHSPTQTSSNTPHCFSIRKSRTVGRTRCDCFHTQEVITPDLPQLWLRLINIDKQLMRCQAGTRPFPSCPPMTPMERKNDLDSAMSWPPSISAKHKRLIFCGRRARLSMAQLDYSHQRNNGQQMFVGVLFLIITSVKLRAIILHFYSIQHSAGSDGRSKKKKERGKNISAGRSISQLRDYLKCFVFFFPIDCAAHATKCPLLSLSYNNII